MSADEWLETVTHGELDELLAGELLDEEDQAVRWERLLSTLGKGFAILAGLSFRKPQRHYEPKDIIAGDPREEARKRRRQRKRPASVAAQKALIGQIVAQHRGSVKHGVA